MTGKIGYRYWRTHPVRLLLQQDVGQLFTSHQRHLRNKLCQGEGFDMAAPRPSLNSSFHMRIEKEILQYHSRPNRCSNPS
jgi:hypothetical protein